MIHDAKPAVCAMFPLGRAVRIDKEDAEKDELPPMKVEYNDFENEEKRKEIEAFAETEDIDPKMLGEFISEYEFSGTMEAGDIRDRIDKPMPLLKKKSLVNRIVDFILSHVEKYQ